MDLVENRVEPNVMLMIDRSGSMSDPIMGTRGTSKIAGLRNILDKVIPQFDGQIRFGLTLFPDPSVTDSCTYCCTPGAILYGCDDHEGTNVQTAIDTTPPGGDTPTAWTLSSILTSGLLADVSHPDYLLLATDGLPNCDTTDGDGKKSAGIISQLYSALGVRTFVIGIGSDTSSDPAILNSWAEAGQTALPSATEYYQANTFDDLQRAFTSIVNSLVSCSFSLKARAPDPAHIQVLDNGTPVLADTANGFSYNDKGPTLSFHGTACDALRNSSGSKIQIVYGCAALPPIIR